jgi:hypothetical protein
MHRLDASARGLLWHLFARDLILGSAIYLGMYQNLVGVRWLVIGATWFLLLAHLVILQSPLFVTGQRDTRPLVVKGASWAFNIAVVAALVESGYHTTALAYVASCICLSLVREKKGFPLKRTDPRPKDSRIDRPRGV